MVTNLPCSNEFLILNRSVTYLCWFYNGDSGKDKIKIDKSCLQLSKKYTEVQCLRFDFMSKTGYRFLDCLTCSHTIFLCRKARVIWFNRIKITPSVLVNCFKSQLTFVDSSSASSSKKTGIQGKNKDSANSQQNQKESSSLVHRMSEMKISPK